MFYTMDKLRQKLDGISAGALRRVIRENSELNDLIKQNHRGKGRHAQYGDPVLDWLFAYFRPKEQLEREIRRQSEILSRQDAEKQRQDDEIQRLRDRLAEAHAHAEFLQEQVCAKDLELKSAHEDFPKRMAILMEADADLKKGFSAILDHMQNSLAGNLENKHAVVTKRLSDITELTKSVATSMVDELKSHDQKLNRFHDMNRATILETNRFAREAVWAQTFRSAISQSEWLKKTSFAPGRWAASFPFLYVLYRIMNAVKPRRLLELGLGQTSTLINQYVSALDDSASVYYTIIEQSPEWISFFKNEYGLSSRATVQHLPVKKTTFRDDINVLVFDGFLDAVGDGRFDFVCIDAPGPDPLQTYRRVDVLDLIPDHLADSFVIVFDDAQLPACQNTLAAMRESLTGAGIAHVEGKYVGTRDLVVIASADWSYLTTL